MVVITFCSSIRCRACKNKVKILLPVFAKCFHQNIFPFNPIFLIKNCFEHLQRAQDKKNPTIPIV